MHKVVYVCMCVSVWRKLLETWVTLLNLSPGCHGDSCLGDSLPMHDLSNHALRCHLPAEPGASSIFLCRLLCIVCEWRNWNSSDFEALYVNYQGKEIAYTRKHISHERWYVFEGLHGQKFLDVCKFLMCWKKNCSETSKAKIWCKFPCLGDILLIRFQRMLLSNRWGYIWQDDITLTNKRHAEWCRIVHKHISPSKGELKHLKLLWNSWDCGRELRGSYIIFVLVVPPKFDSKVLIFILVVTPLTAKCPLLCRSLPPNFDKVTMFVLGVPSKFGNNVIIFLLEVACKFDKMIIFVLVVPHWILQSEYICIGSPPKFAAKWPYLYWRPPPPPLTLLQSDHICVGSCLQVWQNDHICVGGPP